MFKLKLRTWQLTVSLLVVSVGTIFLHWQTLPPEIPLWISRPWGIDQLSGKYGIFWIPGLILTFQIVGMIFAKLLKSDIFLVSIILVTVGVSQIVCTLAFIRIIMMIT